MQDKIIDGVMPGYNTKLKRTNLKMMYTTVQDKKEIQNSSFVKDKNISQDEYIELK